MILIETWKESYQNCWNDPCNSAWVNLTVKATLATIVAVGTGGLGALAMGAYVASMAWGFYRMNKACN